MSYRIAQDFEYVGNDYWRWSAWIEANEAELDRVKEVVWILHPSFKQPRRVSRARADKFRLKTAGWGIFLLRAEVILADGTKLPLKHNLRLEYREESGKEPPFPSTMGAPTIYLSYSTEDSRAAAKLRTGLENAGLKVFDQSRLGPGDPWNDTLRRMIAQSDAVVGLAGEEEISPWVGAEIEAAVASSKPAWLLIAEGASTGGLPSNVRTLTVDVDRLDPAAIAESLRSALGDEGGLDLGPAEGRPQLR